MLLLLTLLAAAFYALPVSAQSMVAKRVMYSSGTGFFVSPQGFIITNAHVVDQCLRPEAELSGAVNAKARILALDKKHDLALLHAASPSRAVAYLSAPPYSISKGDPVLVMGYPEEAARDGYYRVAESEVLNVTGPQNEPHWLQFADAARKGNSGGPLLDQSGHVIGVVTGKTQLMQIDPRTRQMVAVSNSDVAVTLPILKSFLKQNGIGFIEQQSLQRFTLQSVERDARNYITRIRCITAEQPI